MSYSLQFVALTFVAYRMFTLSEPLLTKALNELTKRVQEKIPAYACRNGRPRAGTQIHQASLAASEWRMRRNMEWKSKAVMVVAHMQNGRGKNAKKPTKRNGKGATQEEME